MLAAGLAPYCTSHSWRWSMLLHPLCGNGYNAHSGVIGNIAIVFTLLSVLAGVYAFYRRHNCHVHHCPRISWHPHPEHGHPVCGTHHPAHPKHHRAVGAHFLHASRHRYP